MGKGLYTPGPDTKAEGGQETISGRAETEESQRRNRPNDIQRESGQEKRRLVNSGGLLCFYINARNLTSKLDHFEAWVHDTDPDIIG